MDMETVRWGAGMIVAALCIVLWWNFQNQDREVKSLKKEMTDFKLHVANTYPKQADLERTVNSFERVVERIEGKIDLLFEKIDSKQDKRP